MFEAMHHAHLLAWRYVLYHLVSSYCCLDSSLELTNSLFKATTSMATIWLNWLRADFRVFKRHSKLYFRVRVKKNDNI